MAKPKKYRYSAEVVFDKRMKDHNIVITDKLNKSEVYRKTGYCNKKSAWRGFARISKSLLQADKIEIVK